MGLEPVVRLLLAAMLNGGHVLLEVIRSWKDSPGQSTGKAMGLPESKIGRIQFTPDLMPSISQALMPRRPIEPLGISRGADFQVAAASRRD